MLSFISTDFFFFLRFLKPQKIIKALDKNALLLAVVVILLLLFYYCYSNITVVIVINSIFIKKIILLFCYTLYKYFIYFIVLALI